MKTIGLLGGMTWHSTVDYYRLINHDVQTRLGGSHSASCILLSVEFQEFEDLQTAGDWKRLTELMTDAALKVQTAGADCLVICANTMHKTADALASVLRIPILHIADAAADAITRAGWKTVGLLGTRYTMEMDFYRRRLEDKHGLTVLIPGPKDRDIVHEVIYRELAAGKIVDSSRAEYIRIIEGLRDRGAQGVILGCTEIPLLIKEGDGPLPVFDTTALHAKAAVDFVLA
ncbi:MAG: aspartate/glutamate racemase family protein [Acidobacteriota bacterium]|nr:aspartate/glutamate racemase family protein [Acidobacteriota bacterium]